MGEARMELQLGPRVLFGAGAAEEAAACAAGFGCRALVVTGAHAERAGWLLDRLDAAGVAPVVHCVSREPDVDLVASGVALASEHACDVVVGVGGGSAVDAAKAVAILAEQPGELLDYIEVVGRGEALERPALPWIAVPTTAGSGSEVTRNAVIKVPAEAVKASLRSAAMLPRVAIVDPLLSRSTPRAVTASTGLDALTHCIEAYVSRRANPFTDALCAEGIRRAGAALPRAYGDGEDAAAREDMSLASLFGGFALANAGLGAVHGFAAPAGGMFDVPHGCVCGRFLPHAIEANVVALQQRAPDSPALRRYGDVAGWLTGGRGERAGDAVDFVQQLCGKLSVPALGDYGMTPEHTEALAHGAARASSMRGNPVTLEHDELCALARRAIAG